MIHQNDRYCPEYKNTTKIFFGISKKQIHRNCNSSFISSDTTLTFLQVPLSFFLHFSQFSSVTKVKIVYFLVFFQLWWSGKIAKNEKFENEKSISWRPFVNYHQNKFQDYILTLFSTGGQTAPPKHKCQNLTYKTLLDFS